MILKTNTEYRFDCLYIFSKLFKNQNKGFKVKIVPNVTEDTKFEFEVDDVIYSYAGVKDLTRAFNIRQYDTYFTLILSNDSTVYGILSSLYSGKTVTLPENFDNSKAYYTLIVSSYNEIVEYRFNLVLDFLPDGIELNPERLVF